MNRHRALVVCALLATACQPRYETLELSIVSRGSEETSVATDEVVVPVGTAVAVRVSPVSAGHKDYEDYHFVEMTSQDDEILMVRGGPELDVFVLAGVSVGETLIDVEIRGEWVDTIEGRVTP